MKNFVLLSGLLLLAACSGEEASTPPPAPAETERPKEVEFNPAFTRLAGSWRSQPGSVAGGRFLQVDVASGGGYTIDVRRSTGQGVEVLETGRGRISLTDGKLVAAPGQTQGRTLSGLGAWTGRVSQGDQRTLVIKGADGTEITLAWRSL